MTSNKIQELLRNSPATEDDGSYRAWRPCQQGSVANLKLVPAKASGEPVRMIPYLQPITIEYHRETEQLALLCHSTGMTVFLEGRGLEELGDLIAEKRVKAIYVFDPVVYEKPNNESPVIDKMCIE